MAIRQLADRDHEGGRSLVEGSKIVNLLKAALSLLSRRKAGNPPGLRAKDYLNTTATPLLLGFTWQITMTEIVIQERYH
jgi:hypothetical protein